VKYLITLIFTLTVAHISKPAKIDPDLRSYVQDFKDTSAKFGNRAKINFSVVFGTYRKDVSGVCHSSVVLGGQLVRINKSHFKRYPERMKRMLLFHELAHCEYRRGHDERFYRGLRLSWMFPEMFWFENDLIPGYEKQLFLEKDDLLKKLIDDQYKK